MKRMKMKNAKAMSTQVMISAAQGGRAAADEEALLVSSAAASPRVEEEDMARKGEGDGLLIQRFHQRGSQRGAGQFGILR